MLRIEIVCRNFDQTPPTKPGDTSQRSCSWPVPLEQYQLDFLLSITGMFQHRVNEKDLSTMVYRIDQLFVLITVLQGHLRKNPWLYALMDVFKTDPHFTKDWELRISHQDEAYIEDLFSGKVEPTCRIIHLGPDDSGDGLGFEGEIELTKVVSLPALDGSPRMGDCPREIEADPQSREELFDYGFDATNETPDRQPDGLSSEEIDGLVATLGE